ncbi:MAG: hypothetical protein PWP50_701, partial [Synergistaceae bacterium]|nr:hypothetical protein [Synergistaceae bacterium]
VSALAPSRLKHERGGVLDDEGGFDRCGIKGDWT